MLSPSSSRTYIRLVFIVLLVLTASLLTARYKLAAPYNRPYGAPVNLGHQAWEVSFAKAAGKLATVGGAAAALNTTTGGAADEGYWDEDDDFLDDWGYSSAPSKWDPLEINTTPITELNLKSCILSPGLYDMCSPTSSAKEDATRGKWERIDKDVSKKIGVKYLYLYARRLLPGSTADVVTDLRILDHAPTATDLSSDGVWVEVSTSLREGIYPTLPPLFLHYKLTPQADVRAARRMDAVNGSAGALEPITEVDVLYGGKEVKAFPGFTKMERMITGGEDDPKSVTKTKGTRVGASLAYRKQNQELPPTPVLRFSPSGNFTILQVADLHFSVGPGECRDVDAQHVDACKREGADVYSLKWLETALDEVKPDLVVLSGDQLNGQETSWDAHSVVLKWAPLLYERGIPWATIFGNHDEEATDLDHAAQMNLFSHLPYYVGEAGPTSVDGVGNYVRSIRAPRSSREDTALFSLYFLDSHAYAKKGINPWSKPGYDYIKPNQINWFRGRSAQMHTYLRPYSPPASSSRTGSNRRPSRPRPGQAAAAAAQSAAEDGFDDRRSRLGKRQDDVWSEAELQEMEKELNAGEDEGGFSPQVEPGSHVVNEPDEDDVAFESDEDAGEGGADEVSSSSTTDDQRPGEGGVSTGEELDPLLEAEFEAEAEEGFLDPSPPLPVGPTKANPMTAKPNAMVFFHIPLPQAYTSQIDVAPSGKRLRVGERLEGSGASKTDSGFFEQAVLARGELPAQRGEGDAPLDEFWDGESSSPSTGRPEVKVLAHGHCHNTSDCRRVKGVWICFGGGGSYSGYGNSTFARRMRVYTLSDFGERIETYQLTDTKERINQAVLYGEGSLEEQ